MFLFFYNYFQITKKKNNQLSLILIYVYYIKILEKKMKLIKNIFHHLIQA